MTGPVPVVPGGGMPVASAGAGAPAGTGTVVPGGAGAPVGTGTVVPGGAGAPVGTGTVAAVVGASVAALAELDELPVTEHVARYDALHGELSEALAAIDGI